MDDGKAVTAQQEAIAIPQVNPLLWDSTEHSMARTEYLDLGSGCGVHAGSASISCWSCMGGPGLDPVQGTSLLPSPTILSEDKLPQNCRLSPTSYSPSKCQTSVFFKPLTPCFPTFSISLGGGGKKKLHEKTPLSSLPLQEPTQVVIRCPSHQKQYYSPHPPTQAMQCVVLNAICCCSGLTHYEL